MSENSYFHQTPDLLQEEQRWLEEAKRNPKAFSPVYKKYYKYIYGFIYSKLNDKENTPDLVAQVFVKALKHLPNYEFRGIPYGSWLFCLAKTELNEYYRKEKLMPKSSSDNIVLPFYDSCKFEQAEAENMKERLKIVLSRLKVEEKQLIDLKYFQSYTYAEIGEQLGISTVNAKVKTFRAVERLRAMFGIEKMAA
jgi:RNA polymerase sigma-70 factor, ECF subfamily